MKKTRSLRLLVSAATVALVALAGAPRAAAENLCDSSVNDCRAQLLTLIQNEQVGIDVGFWFMQDARYSAAIIKQWQAGVPVRVLIDPRADPSYPGNADIITSLQQAGIPLRNRTASGILHWKVMLFAGQNVVEFGSANYSPDAFVPETPYTNYVSETIFYEDDAAVVDSFKVKFDDSWTDTTNFANFANINGPLQRVYPTYTLDPDMNWPPSQDYGARAVARYNAEKQQIDVDMYRVTDQRHTNAIIAAFQRGVPVRYMGETLEYRDSSRLWVAWNMDRIYAAGIPMRVRANQGENHAKIVLLYGQGMTIFGSSNWTTPSATSQQEHNYFTTKSTIFQWFEDLFNRKWNNSAGQTETGPFTPLPPDKAIYQSPASDAVGVATSGIVLKWDGGPWAHVYDIYFGTDPNPPLFAANQNLGPDDPTKSPKQYQTIALPTLAAGTTYYWKIVSKTMANLTATGPIWSFTTAGGGGGSVPSPWTDEDIGAVGTAGSASYSNGTFTVNASGADVWGNADAFNYVSQPWTGNGSIVARVDSVTEANQWSKAGVMFRSDLSAGSAQAFVLTSAAKGVAFQRRDAAGGTSVNTSGSAAAPPRWVRLDRSGNTFTAYESSDGSTWTKIGTDTISMPASIYVGLAATAHDNTRVTTATIDSVALSGGGGSGGGLPSPWVDQDVGAVTAPGSAQYANGTFTVSAEGADVWGTADAFHFVYQPLAGDGSITARVAGIVEANAWSKAGVMIRETLDANSAHAFMLVSAAKGVALQWRPTTGGSSLSATGSTAAPPHWVRLVRSGNTITGYESSDGSTWTAVGTETITMTSNVYIGLAVTSHTTSASTTATIDNVTMP